MRTLNAVVDVLLIAFGTIVGLLLVWPAMKAGFFWSDVLQKVRRAHQSGSGS